jgi:hypothetical protein
MGAEHGANPDRKTWLEQREREAEELGYETQPDVVIVGGGQGGSPAATSSSSPAPSTASPRTRW